MTTRKTILVTGGGGNIGSKLIPYLQASADVVSLDLKPVEAASRSLVGSVTDADKVLEAAEGVDAVMHMAYANTNRDDLHHQVDVNFKGAVNVLEACVARGIPRLVFASTVMTVFGQAKIPTAPALHNFVPVNFYSYTKCATELLIEMYVRQHDLCGICLRFGAPMEVTEDPTRFSPAFDKRRDREVMVPFDDLCEAIRLALLEVKPLGFTSLFLVGDYGNNHFDVDRTKRVLGLTYRWRFQPDPETEGAYLIVRNPDFTGESGTR